MTKIDRLLMSWKPPEERQFDIISAMKTIKTVWEWSAETEAKRLIHTAHNIADGFFRVNNFFVVPYRREVSQTSQTVPFPELPYRTIPRFWDRVKRTDIKNFPLEFDAKLVEDVSELLERSNLYCLQRLDLYELQQIWKKAGGEILEEIYKIIPEKKDAISKIIIHPTSFGTTCSFSIADSFPAAVEMYLRADQDIYALTEAILSAITRNEVYRELDGMWSESELLVDWLIMKSSLSPILKKYQPKTNFIPTVKYTRMKRGARLMTESEEFYRRLGAPILKNVFGLEDGRPTVSGRPLENISAREREILAAMIKKSNAAITIDETADLLFKSDEEFSLQAIAKTIQRLRDKLEQNGVSGSFIQTLRGQGYVLKN